jgi:inorganic pyrophosphatase
MNKKHISIGDKYPEIVNAFVEMESGGCNKYEYDEESDLIKLDRVFHSPLVNPTDYGFVPQTIAEDGDNLDILIISNKPTLPGCVIEARIMGMLEMSDDKGIDNKIIAVSAQDPDLKNVKTLEGLDPNILQKILGFFDKYKELENKSVEIGDWKSKEEAIELIEKAHNAFLNADESS